MEARTWNKLQGSPWGIKEYFAPALFPKNLVVGRRQLGALQEAPLSPMQVKFCINEVSKQMTEMVKSVSQAESSDL